MRESITNGFVVTSVGALSTLRTFTLLTGSLLAAAASAAEDDFATAVLTPFWRSQPMTESMFFIQSSADSRPRSALLFKPSRLLKVVSATRETTFTEGIDYRLDPKSGVLELPPGSRIPYKTFDQLHPLMSSDEPKISLQAGDPLRGLFFDNQDGYHRLQVEVTYECQPGQWQGPTPRYAGDILPRLLKKLGEGDSVKIFLSGDSISEGYNASRFTGARPGCPAYGELFALAVEKHFGSKVEFQNFAVGGWQSSQGLKQVIDDRVGEQHPDLMIVAFGMNDVFRRDPAAFKQNIKGILNAVRQDSPATEFILISTMLGNAEWGMPMEQFALYRQALSELCEPGIVLADITAIWEELLKRKSFYDLTGNGVNHPNDFGHRIYAQALMAMLIESNAE
ncbi:MAG: SGNH/GDSL hydrolase family protein [Planctomycetales bacterium]|nr:SGNH/GDSL hydrolase family protein [Planctomycetales bacterium]